MSNQLPEQQWSLHSDAVFYRNWPTDNVIGLALRACTERLVPTLHNHLQPIANDEGRCVTTGRTKVIDAFFGRPDLSAMPAAHAIVQPLHSLQRNSDVQF